MSKMSCWNPHPRLGPNSTLTLAPPSSAENLARCVRREKYEHKNSVIAMGEISCHSHFIHCSTPMNEPGYRLAEISLKGCEGVSMPVEERSRPPLSPKLSIYHEFHPRVPELQVEACSPISSRTQMAKPEGEVTCRRWCCNVLWKKHDGHPDTGIVSV